MREYPARLVESPRRPAPSADLRGASPERLTPAPLLRSASSFRRFARFASFAPFALGIATVPALASSGGSGPAHLTIENGVPFVSEGPAGGPFSLEEKKYSLRNTGGEPLHWLVMTAMPGFVFKQEVGVLLAGEKTDFTAMLDHNLVDFLPPGAYGATLYVFNLTNGSGDTSITMSLNVQAPPRLEVHPKGGLFAHGPQGGPFQPPSKPYVLRNSGGAPLDWNVVGDHSGLVFSKSQGTLAPNATEVVEVSFDPAVATTLPQGSYGNLARFKNITNGSGDTERDAHLTVAGSGSGQPVILPGSGFQGQTPEPSPIGSGKGADAKVIARWDLVPFQDIDEGFGVGVIAFHMNGIDRVEIAVEGGAWTPIDRMELNPRTGVYEYWGVLRESDFSLTGPIELRAIAYPTVGIPRLLEPITLFADPQQKLPNLTRYVAPVAAGGDDDKGDGSLQKPFATLMRAARDISDDGGNGTADGGTIYLMPGDYVYGTYAGHLYTETKNTWLTVRPAPGYQREDVRLVTGGSGGLRTKLIHLQDLTILTSLSTVTPLEDYLWLDGCEAIGGGTGTNFGTAGLVSTPAWNGIYATDFIVRNNRSGLGGADLERGNYIENIGEDAFTNTRMVVNCTVNGIDKPDQSGYHPDVFQIGIYEENWIVYGLQAYNVGAQGLFCNGDPSWRVDNVAMVNILIDAEVVDGPYFSQWKGIASNHVLLWNVTSTQRFYWRSDNLKNVSVESCAFQIVSSDYALDDSGFETLHYVQSSFKPGKDITVGNPHWKNQSKDDFTPLPSSPLVGRVAQPRVPADVKNMPRGNPAAIGALEP